jgi:general secretion pathway protein L
MREFFVIHYRPDAADGQHYWASGGEQHPSITLGKSSPQEMASIARGKKVSLLIDSRFTTVMSVTVPSKNRSKQLQAIPYAMEDHLAEDLEDIHFAIGKADSHNRIPVIAIKRSLMQDTLALFSDAGVHIDYMSADCSALPISDNSWSLLLFEQSAIISTSSMDAQSCESENLEVILRALLEQASAKPAQIKCFCTEADQAQLAFLQQLDSEITLQPIKSHPLEIFASQLEQLPSLNLLQGEFTQKRKSANNWLQPWKYAAIAASLFIALYLGLLSLQSRQLEAENILLSKNIETEFRRAMPEARSLSNMQKRVERHLQELKSAAGRDNSNHFLHLLSSATPALSQASNITINAAVFRSNHLDLDISTNSLQNIEQVKSQLLKLPDIKTVLSTTVEKDSVNGRLRLEAKG